LTPFFGDRLARAAKLLELAVFPSRCKICRRLLEAPGESVLCRGCLGKIVSERTASCLRCGRFFDGAGEPHICAACLNAPPPVSIHRSGGRYRGELKDAILLLKYKRYRPLGEPLARFLFEALRKEASLWAGVEVLIPVPLYKKRRRDRGFNQAELLARELGRRTGLPCETDILVKTKHTPPQTSLEHGDRRTNVRDAFRVVRPERIGGKIVLLVDDVYTTGSTLAACATALKGAGAGEVRAVTLARA
jgi:competence protein ComFC